MFTELMRTSFRSPPPCLVLHSLAQSFNPTVLPPLSPNHISLHLAPPLHPPTPSMPGACTCTCSWRPSSGGVAYPSSTFADDVLFAAAAYCKAAGGAFCTSELAGARSAYDGATWQTSAGWDGSGNQANALLASMGDATYAARIAKNTEGWLNAGRCQGGCRVCCAGVTHHSEHSRLITCRY